MMKKTVIGYWLLVIGFWLFAIGCQAQKVQRVMIPGKGNSATTVYKTFTLQDVYLQDGVRMAKIHMGMKYLELPDTTSNLQLKSSDYVIGDGMVLFDVTHGTLTSAEMNIVAVIDVCDLVAGDTLASMNVNQKITLRNLQ